MSFRQACSSRSRTGAFRAHKTTSCADPRRQLSSTMAAFRPAVGMRGPIVAALITAAVSMYPRRSIHADAPSNDELPAKKPIYSAPPTVPVSTTPKLSSSSPVSEPNLTSPTPTDRLITQIKRSRLFLYDQSLAAENGTNNFMSWVLQKETSVTNTIASLAPDPRTGEQLLPGLIYTLVATLGGSIMSRNRGILIRAACPAAVGLAAGWYFIPVTMQNVADLSWQYEKRVPAISETHGMLGGFAREAWRQTKIYTEGATKWADETAGVSRDKVEGWVKGGK